MGTPSLINENVETKSLLDRKEQFIDYYDILRYYNLQDIFECLAIIILFALLTRFSKLFIDLSIQVNVISYISHLILLFCVLWWVYIFLFSEVFTYSFGHRLSGYRNSEITILSMLGSVVMVSNQPRLGFEHEQTEELVKFFALMVIVIYVTRLCIVCQVTSLIIE